MSVKEINSEVENISFEFLNILEKTRNPEERIKIFETYYKVLLMLEKIKESEIKIDK
ncbi:hypothetical protein [Hydrogenothermus marinus]|uniref:Uncharacterized protein n=1 Tax=Hydrogenothermus marinus TaxID=133270 RepID=A0A3M0BMN0_9AQUI|nr:hypothetical protein [Hydrogenothermus marinus]RMA96088.1 hypothetical protein CLV39_1099 [Hydrogenothermus marinus]